MAEAAPAEGCVCGDKGNPESEGYHMTAGDETGWSYDGYPKPACEQGKSGG